MNKLLVLLTVVRVRKQYVIMLNTGKVIMHVENILIKLFSTEKLHPPLPFLNISPSNYNKSKENN